MPRQTKADKEEQQRAIKQLREWLPPGSTARTIIRHVSRSGMQREISVVVMVDGEPFECDYWVARALGDRIGTHGGIVVGGCGMDMGFHLVYSLSQTLYPDGFDCIGEGDNNWHGRCPSNDHSNDRGERDYSPTRHHSSGGYAISQRWL